MFWLFYFSPLVCRRRWEIRGEIESEGKAAVVTYLVDLEIVTSMLRVRGIDEGRC